MPKHDLYIEPFCGAAVIAKRKLPARETWLVDADPAAPGLAMTQAEVFVGCALHHLREWRCSMDWGTLVYCDPPYLRSVRGAHRYRVEFDTEDQHRELIGELRSLQCFVMLSGYASFLYAELLSDWRQVRIPTVNRAGKPVTECLWMNFPATVARHDVRFQGDTFRERERIKRKAERWHRKFLAMTAGERAAVLAKLSEVSSLNDPGV
jgi:hypothetical protein